VLLFIVAIFFGVSLSNLGLIFKKKRKLTLVVYYCYRFGDCFLFLRLFHVISSVTAIIMNSIRATISTLYRLVAGSQLAVSVIGAFIVTACALS
jgi:hypothetical protein